LAVACRRLGSNEHYLAAVGQVLALPVKKNLPYQTSAIGYLLQTHPARAMQAWERIHGELAGLPDLQPAWVFGHYLQQEYLAGGKLIVPLPLIICFRRTLTAPGRLGIRSTWRSPSSLIFKRVGCMGMSCNGSNCLDEGFPMI